MSAARDQILARIRAANRSVGLTPGGGPAAGQRADRAADADAAYATLARRYLRAHHDPAAHDIAALFAERAADYRAVVERVPGLGLAAAIARVLAARVAAVPGPVRGAGGTSRRLAGRTARRDHAGPRRAPASRRPNSTGRRRRHRLRGRGRRDRHDHPGPRPRPGPPRAHPGARLPPGRRARGPGRRRPGRRVRPARPGPAAHPDLRSLGHQRHRAASGSRACTARATCTCSPGPEARLARR